MPNDFPGKLLRQAQDGKLPDEILQHIPTLTGHPSNFEEKALCYRILWTRSKESRDWPNVKFGEKAVCDRKKDVEVIVV